MSGSAPLSPEFIIYLGNIGYTDSEFRHLRPYEKGQLYFQFQQFTRNVVPQPVVGDVPVFRCSAPVSVADTVAPLPVAAATTGLGEQRAGALKWAKEQYPDQPWIWNPYLSKSKAAQLKNTYKKKIAEEIKSSKILSAEEQHLRAKAWADKTLPKMPESS
jgi:hypothetical protein